MRLLLSCLLSSFFFLAPATGRAGDMGVHKVSKQAGKFPKTGFLNYLQNEESPAIITTTSHSNGPVTRCKTFSSTNFIDAVSFIHCSYIVPAAKYFVPLYQSFEPIGLQLIFPKHYFW